MLHGKIVEEHETKYYYYGELHRTDGPAIEYSNGEKHWFRHGVRHRVDGPAIEFGTIKTLPGVLSAYRFNHDRRVPEYLRYVEFDSRIKYWYYNGCKYSFEHWLDRLQISKEEKVLLILKWK